MAEEKIEIATHFHYHFAIDFGLEHKTNSIVAFQSKGSLVFGSPRAPCPISALMYSSKYELNSRHYEVC